MPYVTFLPEGKNLIFNMQISNVVRFRKGEGRERKRDWRWEDYKEDKGN